MERTKMTLKDLAVSFHFPKFSTSRDFYKAFGCRVCMLLSYQMISVYQLYIVEDYVHQTKTEAAGTIATMSIITMVVSLTASLI
ncbi:MFS transporter, partial [Bifidobacterium longum]